MRRSETSENPYQPPATESRRRGGLIRRFQVGVKELNTVFVESSFWTGLKTYATDATGNSGPVHRGPCQFEVGHRERHQVMIEVDGLVRVNAYVDGELLEANLFAPLRIFSFLIALVLAVIAVIVFLFAYFGFDLVVDEWIDSHMQAEAVYR